MQGCETFRVNDNNFFTLEHLYFRAILRHSGAWFDKLKRKDSNVVYYKWELVNLLYVDWVGKHFYCRVYIDEQNARFLFINVKTLLYSSVHNLERRTDRCHNERRI